MVCALADDCVSLAPYRDAFGTNDATVTIVLFVVLGAVAIAVACLGAAIALLARSAFAHRCLRWALAAGITILAVRLLVSCGWLAFTGSCKLTGEEPLIADPWRRFASILPHFDMLVKLLCCRGLVG